MSQASFPMSFSFSELRLKAGLSVEELADLSGYAIRTVYRWESGDIEPRKAVIDLLSNKIEEKKLQMKESGKFDFIDLFAGIGGLRLGFEKYGGRCVFTSEWDKNAQKTYMANFPDDGHSVAGDITKISARDIPKHDVLLAGFPCQPFSIAGVSKKISMGRKHGFLDKTQGTLFFDVARIIAHHKPAAFLLENVKNLLSHDKGRTFQVIKKTLEEDLGYSISYRVIDAKYFVPQHRERIFIVGFKKDVGFNLNDLKLPTEVKKLKTILHSEEDSGLSEARFVQAKTGKPLDKYTLTPGLWSYLQRYAAKHKEKGNGFGFGICGPDSCTRTLSARYYKDGSEILIAQKGKNPRRLTPRECARLMGFDNKKRKFIIPVSDTQAYKQFGNAVVVPVVDAVASHMVPHLLTVLKEG